VQQLGEPLFQLIYGNLSGRGRHAPPGGRAAAYDDAFFRRELMTRLGPSRMQYVQLIDQILYHEESM